MSGDAKFGQRQEEREVAALLLSRLPLPRTALPVPPPRQSSRAAAPQAQAASQPSPPRPPPTIRILAVADVDLRSAARLAEYALREREDIARTELGAGVGVAASSRGTRRGGPCRPRSGSSSSNSDDELSAGAYEMRTRPLGGGAVDLCIACGPFVHPCPPPGADLPQRDCGDVSDSDNGGGSDSVGSASCSCSWGSSSDLGSAEDGLEGVANDDDDDVEEDDGDGSTSSGSSATSSGAGGYDNTGGFGYREHVTAGRRSPRANRSSTHICDRHYRRKRHAGRDNDDGHGGDADHAAVASRPEHDASNEGILTSTLAQLENIVCRVLYVPGQGDPPSLFGRKADVNAADDSADKDTFTEEKNRRGDDSDPTLFHRDSLQVARDRNMPRPAGSISRHFGAITGVASANGGGPKIDIDSRRVAPVDHKKICRGDGNDDAQKQGGDAAGGSNDDKGPHGDLITEAELTPHKRLTPNSRNVHRRWVQLGPGLGIAGLARDLGCRPTDVLAPIEFDQGRYGRTLHALLGMAPPSQNAALFSSSLLASRPSQAIVLTNLPGENERNVTPGKRRGKRDKEVSLRLIHAPEGGSDVVDNRGGGLSIPAAYRDLLALATNDNDRPEDSDGQVLLKVASPPPQSRRRSRRRHLGDRNGADQQPFVFETDGAKLVMPGSLRKSGDFALIDVALVRDDRGATSTTSSPSRGRGAALGPQSRGRRLSPPSYRWSVDRVQFRSMGV